MTATAGDDVRADRGADADADRGPAGSGGRDETTGGAGSRFGGRISLRAWYGLAAAFVAYAIVAANALALRSPLAHDEAVYALRSRDFLDGWATFSGSYWADYRAPGLPLVLSVVNRVIGAHVLTMRLTVVAMGAVIMVCTWLIARRLGSDRPAVAPFLLSLSAGFVFAATTVLADVPGAAFGLPAVVVYLVEVERQRLRWSFLAVPLLTAFATISRFGAPFMIGAGMATVFLLAIPAILRRRNWLLVAQSACLAVGTALVVWLVLLTELLSDAVGIGRLSPADANRALVGGKNLTARTGFEDLKTIVNPWSGHPLTLWSRSVAVVFLIGFLAAWVGVATRRTAWRPVVFGTIAGVLATAGVVVSVGLVVHNYLALSIPYWAIVSGSGLGWIGREVGELIGDRRGLLALAGAAVVVAASALVVDAKDDAYFYHWRQQFSFDALRSVSIESGRQLGPDCLLVTSYAPQAGYYSECSVMPWIGWDQDIPVGEVIARALGRADTAGVTPDDPGAIAALIVEGGKRQPADTELLVSPALGPTIAELGDAGDGRTYVRTQLVDDCVVDGGC